MPILLPEAITAADILNIISANIQISFAAIARL
jgi:hypothetical protein